LVGKKRPRKESGSASFKNKNIAPATRTNWLEKFASGKDGDGGKGKIG